MYKILNFIAAVFALLGTLLIGNMLYEHLTGGFENGEGMAILVFQLFGVICAGLALVLGFIGRLLAKRKNEAPGRLGTFAMGLALLTLLMLILAMIFG